MTKISFLTKWIALPIFLWALFMASAHSANIIVDSSADNLTQDGACTLREAIENAQGASHADCVAGTAGLDEVTFSLTTPAIINLTGVLPAFADDINIVNSTGDSITVRRDTGGDYRIFTIDSGVSVTLDGLNIENGRVTGLFSNGGGVYNAGTLNVKNCTISNNEVTGFDNDGGGICNDGTLTVINCTISNNESSGDDAGGVYNYGFLTITDSVISDNQASDKGGAIYNKAGTVKISNSTVTENSAEKGAGIFSNDELEINNTTISNNEATKAGGGIVSGGDTKIANSTISENTINVSNGDSIINDGKGAGIYNNDYLNVSNSTISGNSIHNITDSPISSDSIDVGMGAGIYDKGNSNITNSTISGNSIMTKGSGAGISNNAGNVYINNSTITNNSILGAFGAGGGLWNNDIAEVKNTIIAGNSASSSPDVIGEDITGNNNNLIGNLGNKSYLGNSTIGTGSDIVAPSFSLCSLQNNGGSTATHAFLPNSQAIDTGNNALIPTSMTTDQRGELRVVDSVVDIGAFEFYLPTSTVVYDFSALSFNAPEGDTTNTINIVTIIRTGDLSISSTVDVILTGSNSAKADIDFTIDPITVSFNPCEGSKIVPIEILGNTYFEPDKTIELSLVNFTPTGAAGTTQPTATLTITNDDVDIKPVLGITTNLNSFLETAGAKATTATVSRTGSTVGDLVVNLSSSDISEITILASVTIPDGETSVNFDIDALDDSEVDGAQTVTITASATDFADSTITVSVTDDDVLPPEPEQPEPPIPEPEPPPPPTIIWRTLTITITDNGSVNGIHCPFPPICTNTYSDKTTVNLTPIPETGYVFDKWLGGCGNSFKINADMACEAIFVEIAPKFDSQPAPNSTLNLSDSNPEQSITINEIGNGDLKISSYAFKGANARDFSVVAPTFPFTIVDGGAAQVVTVRCEPNDISIATLEIETNDIDNKLVSYNFECIDTSPDTLPVTPPLVTPPLVTHSLRVTTEGEGSVIKTPAGVECGDNCAEYSVDNKGVALEVTLQPSPDNGWQFETWKGDCQKISPSDVASGKISVIMNRDYDCIASFFETVVPFSKTPPVIFNEMLTVTTTGNGGGVIISVPVGINCGVDCSETYPQNTAVTLTAEPDNKSQFFGWGGDCDASGNVNMVSERSCNAHFTLIKYGLQITIEGNGQVNFNNGEADVACETNCAQNFTTGTIVKLTLKPATGYKFNGWDEGCKNRISENGDISINSNINCSAYFIPKVYTLTVNVTEGGTVTNFAEIDCGTACSANYPHGTEVTLTSKPKSHKGYQFVGWNDDCQVSALPETKFIMARDMSCTATFNLITLTVIVEGSGKVTINGEECEEKCTKTDLANRFVELKADTDWEFYGWSGEGCNSNKLTQNFLLVSNRTCRARFASDSDGDGVPDRLEENAPNNGDGNGDGKPDKEQSWVSSVFDGFNKNYTTIETNPGCGIKNVKTDGGAMSKTNLEPNHYAPQKLSFEPTCDETDVTIFYHGVSTISSSFSLPQLNFGRTSIGGKKVTTAKFKIFKNKNNTSNLKLDERTWSLEGITFELNIVSFSRLKYKVKENRLDPKGIKIKFYGDAVSGNVTASCESVDDTAKVGEDYKSVNCSVTLRAKSNNTDIKQDEQYIYLSPIDNDTYEGSRTLKIRLTGTSRDDIEFGGFIETIVTILDDECSPADLKKGLLSEGCNLVKEDLDEIGLEEIKEIELEEDNVIEEITVAGDTENEGEVIDSILKGDTNNSGKIIGSILEGEVISEPKALIVDSTFHKKVTNHGDVFGSTFHGMFVNYGEINHKCDDEEKDTNHPCNNKQNSIFRGEVRNKGEIAKATFKDGIVKNEGTIENSTFVNVKVTNEGTIINSTFVNSEMTNDGTIANSTFENAEVINNDTIADSTFQGGSVINNDTISDATFTGEVEVTNNGLISNAIIDYGVTISGGTLAGKIDNNGIIENFTFQDARSSGENIIEGGTLSGNIYNDGTGIFRNITLTADDTIITGGKLAGNIIGFAKKPAMLVDVEILDDSHLENVIIGNDVTFGKNIIFGIGVVFKGSQPPCTITGINWQSQNEQSSFSCEIITRAYDGTPQALPTTRHPNNVRLPYLETYYLALSATINVDEPQHVGELAEVLVMATHNNASSYYPDKQTWKLWEGGLDNFNKIPPATENPVELQLGEVEIFEISFYEGRMREYLGSNLGEFKFYIGYRLEDGTVIFNGNDKPISLFLGNAKSIDVTPNQRQASNEIVATTSFFTYSVNDKTGNNFVASDNLDIKAHIDIDPRHVAKTANIYMVAYHQDRKYTRNGENWQEWDSQLDSLQPAQYDVKLSEIIEVSVYHGNGIPGEFSIYVGYSLDNEVIFYGAEPIRLIVR